MQVKNGDTFSDPDDEAGPAPERSPPEKSESRGAKDRTAVPTSASVETDAPRVTHQPTRKPALVVGRTAHPNAPASERRLTVPASHGGVTIVAQKGAVLNVKLEVVVPANTGHRGSKDSKLLLGASTINVEDDVTAEGDDDPTKPPPGSAPPVSTGKPAKKDRTA